VLMLLEGARPQTAAHKMTVRQTPIVKFWTTQVIVQTFLLLIFMFEPLHKTLSSRGLADDEVYGRARVWLRASTKRKFISDSFNLLAPEF